MRPLSLLAVATLHAVFIAGLVLLAPPVRERFVSHAPVFVRFLSGTPRIRADVKHLAHPLLHEPPIPQVAPPSIAIASEIPVATPREAPALIQVASRTAGTAPAEAPRFDVAYLNNPAPSYPMLSRRMGEQGRVLLRVRVSAAGDPEDVEVSASSGSERLDRAAIDAVRRWRFVPARLGAETVAGYAFVPVLFKLDT